MNRLHRAVTTSLLSLALAALLLAPVSLFAQAEKPAAPAKTPARPTPWTQIKKPALPAFHPQQPTRVELENGMVIFLQEDHELPLIEGIARIRGGSREEPAVKAGLVSLLGQSWRTGGTKSKTGDQLDDVLETRAARIETSGGTDSTNMSWSCLKQDMDTVLPVFVELLQQPEFREDKITLAKTQQNTAISRRNDNFLQIAFREGNKLAYGADNPYARVIEYYTVAAVTRDDLLAWHHAHVHPNNIILGVVGDFDSREMEAKLRAAFGSWPAGPKAESAAVEFKHPKPGIYYAAKEDVNQSAVFMLDLGITRDNPDYYAVEVMNEVLGGGFASRLFSSIRSKKGLAYAVFGSVGSAFDHPGVLQVGMTTKSQTTAASIDALREELDKLDKNPATAEEMKRAKDSILNSFVFRFDSKDKILRERMGYEFYGYPADFLERYRAAIEKVTAADVARVTHQYVHKDQLAVLVVGKAADFEKPLASFGAVTNLDISIPESAPGGAKKATESNPEGIALIAKVVEALGGAEKVKAVKSVSTKATAVRKTPMGEIPIEAETVTIFPDSVYQKVKTPMGEMLTVFSPASSYMGMGGQTGDMPSALKDDATKQLKRSLLYVAQHAADPKFIFVANGTEKIGDVEAKVVEINADGAETRWWVDPQSGKVLRTAFQTTARGGPALQLQDNSDWRTVDGISLPFKQAVSQDGQPAGSNEMKELVINPTVDPKLFERPAAGGEQKP
ncbi:MAG: M16 family metallopeptidase [Terriglobales bacterium]